MSRRAPGTPKWLMKASQERLYADAAAAGYTAYLHQGLVTPNVLDLDLLDADYQTAMGMLAEQEANDELKLRTYIQYFFKSKTATADEVVQYRDCSCAISTIRTSSASPGSRSTPKA